MHKIERIFYSIVTAVCCGLLPFGCVKEKTAAPSELHNAAVQLSVGSRAVDQTDGTPADAESAIHTLRVYAFVGGRLAGHYYNGNLSGSPHTFYMDLTFYAMQQDVVFYAVANESAMITAGLSAAKFSETTTEEDLNKFTFTQLDSDVEGKGLPMYCKTEPQNLDFGKLKNEAPSDPGHAGHQLLDSKIELSLQRPMGKLGVFAAKKEGDSGELKITGMTILEAGTRTLNYLMPQTEETLKRVSGISGDFSLAVVPESVDKTLSGNISPEERENPANYTPVLAEPFYPFENPWGSNAWNSKGDDHGNVLRIDYSIDGTPRSGLVYLPKIERNKYYTVCCLINNEGKIIVEYTVADWDTEEKYELEFDYPTYNNPITPSGSVSEPVGGIYEQPEVWYNTGSDGWEDGSYSFDFTITGPVGQTWKPVLDGNPGYFAYSVWQGGVQLEETEEGGYGVSPDPYIIKVKALGENHLDAGGNQKTTGLGISYVPKWDPNGTSMLLINGLTGNLKWEGSVIAETIVIKQVERPQN